MEKKKLFLLLLCLFVIACSSDSENSPTQEELNNSTPVNILFLPKAASYDEPMPRMVAEIKGWNIVELTNPDNPGTMILHFLEQGTKNNHVMILTDSTALITTCPSSNFSPSRKAILAALTSNGMKAALCNVNWSSGTYSIESETTIDNFTTRAAGYHDLDFAKESMFKMLDKLGERIESLNNWAGFLGTESSAIADVWTNFVIPVAKYQLYSDEPEKLGEIEGEYIKSNAEGLVVNLMPSSVQRAWYGAHLATSYITDLWPYVESKIPEKEIPDYTTDNSLHYWVRNLSDIDRRSVPLQETYKKTKPKYMVTISEPCNVTETEATVSGRFSLNDGNEVGIIKMGYAVILPSGVERTIDAWELPETTIKDLQPGTKYKVYAFVKTPFERHCSEAKEFVTDGFLEISPTDLSFESKGGSRGVVVTVGNRMTWDITNKPDWCSITKGNGTFFVDVKSTEESRSGTITITATLANGKTKTGTVNVVQEREQAIIWGAYSVMFSGKIVTKTQTMRWQQGRQTKNTTKEEDMPNTAILTVEDGKCKLTAMIGSYISIADWEIGNTPPPLYGQLEHSSFQQSVSSTSISISGEGSFYIDIGGIQKGDVGWEKGTLSYKVYISGLDTNSPKLESEYKYDYIDYTDNDLFKDDKEEIIIFSSQTLSGTKL